MKPISSSYQLYYFPTRVRAGMGNLSAKIEIGVDDGDGKCNACTP